MINKTKEVLTPIDVQQNKGILRYYNPYSIINIMEFLSRDLILKVDNDRWGSAYIKMNPWQTGIIIIKQEHIDTCAWRYTEDNIFKYMLKDSFKWYLVTTKEIDLDEELNNILDCVCFQKHHKDEVIKRIKTIL